MKIRDALTPVASLAFSSACSLSSRVEKTLFCLGSSFIASYHVDLVHFEPGAAMCRMRSGSSVTNRLGPTLAGEPVRHRISSEISCWRLLCRRHTIFAKRVLELMRQSAFAFLLEQP